MTTSTLAYLRTGVLAAPATRGGAERHDRSAQEFYRARRSGQQRGYVLYLSLSLSLWKGLFIFLDLILLMNDELLFYVITQFFIPLHTTVVWERARLLSLTGLFFTVSPSYTVSSEKKNIV